MLQHADPLLSRFFLRYDVAPLDGGASGAGVFLVRSDRGDHILKTQASNGFQSLRNELANYTWLSGKIKVPKVLAFDVKADTEYLLMTRLPGQPLLDLQHIWRDDLWVRRFAETLKCLHTLPLDRDAPYKPLDSYLASARQNIETGSVNIDDLQEDNKSFSLEQLYERLASLRPALIDPVFIHGDYCPGNIIYDGDQRPGLIDIGRGGVGDRYHDLALALRFLRDEFQEPFISLFLQVYGLEDLDSQKLAFYELLDEFF